MPGEKNKGGRGKNFLSKPEFLIFLFSVFVCLLGLILVKPMDFNLASAWDGGTYARMADRGLDLGASPPFSYRILIPLIAHFIPLPAVPRFLLLNIISIILIAQLLYIFLRGYVLSERVCLITVLLWLSSGLLSWYFFYPVMVDLPMMAVMLSAFISARQNREIWFGFFLALGALSKEVCLLVLVYHLVLNRNKLKSVSGIFQLLLCYLPAILLFGLVRALIAQGGFSYWQEAQKYFIGRFTSPEGLLRLAVSCFQAYDIVLIILLAFLPGVIKIFKQKPEWFWYLIFNLPLLGGTNMELYWFYLFPLFYLLLAEVLQDNWLLLSQALIYLPLLLYRFFAARRFFIGYPTSEDQYLSLWANWMTLPQLSLYVLIASLLLAFLLLAKIGVMKLKRQSNPG